MPKIVCPVCGGEFEVGSVELHEVLECPVCGVELEVVSLDPLVVEEVPEVEEDWGE
ncbi:lysine biosynthesis protein [Pyrococcus sp. NA2]|uniref:lysine biosynthesis protein LysW n=1 Tax=Pyrococcus sp. (strain NA2) TaxID=342949 RepID=UPI000209AAD0|nr:lysine biosynthesis protein LysW [Pyrococcus sp. NA2]AEC51415.1 lysine biosynthesis protein [Pyrococcus sp. NA2]